MWEYLAGVFDMRGFLQVNLVKDSKGRTKFNVFFNFTERDLEIFKCLSNWLNRNGIKNSIYRIRRVKGEKEFQLYITNRRDSISFLEHILYFSLRKEEIVKSLNLIKPKSL